MSAIHRAFSHWKCFWREMACFAVGHIWKSSWRRRADYDMRVADARFVTDDRNLLSYADRQSGNPYFEHSAGWHYKCRRCRRTLRSVWPRFQFHEWIWQACTNTVRSWWIVASMYSPFDRDPALRTIVSWPARLAMIFVQGPLFAIEQAYLGYLWHDGDFPEYPGYWLSLLERKVADWVEKGINHGEP